ncbi:MAG: hypothetical protein HQM01_12430 [Magnetococcales bacterium]|nr:hypothetical protein [Magnetococcales bacterium]
MNDTEIQSEEGRIQQSLSVEKDKIYYEVCLNGWIQTKMERDKSLLTISSAAIAGLIGVLNTDIGNSFDKKVCIAFAVLFFSACLFVVIVIFNKNSEYLQAVVKEENSEKVEKRLIILDLSAFYFFISGAIFVILLGVMQFH